MPFEDKSVCPITEKSVNRHKHWVCEIFVNKMSLFFEHYTKSNEEQSVRAVLFQSFGQFRFVLPLPLQHPPSAPLEVAHSHIITHFTIPLRICYDSTDFPTKEVSHLSKEAYMSVSWGKRTTKLDKSTILYAIANRKYVEAGEPFFLTDIVIEGVSEENIRYHLKKLTDDGVICRFESGVYYIPKINIFGEQSSLSAETVALHKYIFRRPAVEVTEENAYVLQLLNCLKDI